MMNTAGWLAGCSAVMLMASLAVAARLPGEAMLGGPELRAARRPDTGSSSCDTAVPQRVVSAALLADELLLGMLPFDRWVAVSYVVDWPGSTPVHAAFPKNLVRVDGSSEQILLQRPDLVVLSDYNDAAVAAQLRAAGVCVRWLESPRSFEELFRRWLQLGHWVGVPQRAEALVADAERRLASLPRGSREGARRVLLLEGSFGYGEGTLQAECLRRIGLENVLDGARWGATPALNVEHLLALTPDTLFVAADVVSPGPATPEQLPPGVPWHAVDAVARGRAFAVPASWMGSVSHHALAACESYARHGLGVTL